VARFNSESVGVGAMIGCTEQRGERLGLVVGRWRARDSDRWQSRSSDERRRPTGMDRIWSETVQKGFPLQEICLDPGGRIKQKCGMFPQETSHKHSMCFQPVSQKYTELNRLPFSHANR